ncbi:MAG: cation:proton antiporter [Hyphomicrobiaceae bacterium]
MQGITLVEICLLLTAAALAAPVARLLKVGSVLGYLFAGMLIGPFGIGRVFSPSQAQEFLSVAEFGIVLLLFLIGLELKPTRLWSMRSTIVGAGGVQLAATGLLLGVAAAALGFAWQAAIFIGLALALSSTPFALQMLDEKGELTQRHGRMSFSVLLFQDLAAIPLIALAPLFAVATVGTELAADLKAAAWAVFVIASVILVGRYGLDLLFQLVARTELKEAMTALALLTVATTAAVMQSAGLSASLGGFIAGALLADSSYRHQLEADLKPFEGLLLGLFFTAIGMSLQFDLLVSEPWTIALLVAGLVIIKAGVLYGVGRWQGLDPWAARRFGYTLSQGGEFSFVLLATGTAAGVINTFAASLGALVVTLSMVATPLLLLFDEWLAPRKAPPVPASDPPPEASGHVIIAGFGRFGQITARVLRARRIPFTALDLDAEQIAMVKRFGNEAFFGDASRPDILVAARANEARAIVVAVDDVEASLRIVSHVRAKYPTLPIFARARDRQHYHRLMDLGVENIRRETYLSALDLTRTLLKGLGLSEREVEFTIQTFDSHDHQRLIDDYQHYNDQQKLQEMARSTAENLERIFAEDADPDLTWSDGLTSPETPPIPTGREHRLDISGATAALDNQLPEGNDGAGTAATDRSESARKIEELQSDAEQRRARAENPKG